jgi:hypothetical protein
VEGRSFGITIGSGIFRTPPPIAGLVPHPLVIIGLRTALGLIGLVIAATGFPAHHLSKRLKRSP